MIPAVLIVFPTLVHWISLRGSSSSGRSDGTVASGHLSRSGLLTMSSSWSRAAEHGASLSQGGSAAEIADHTLRLIRQRLSRRSLSTWRPITSFLLERADLAAGVLSSAPLELEQGAHCSVSSSASGMMFRSCNRCCDRSRDQENEPTDQR